MSCLPLMFYITFQGITTLRIKDFRLSLVAHMITLSVSLLKIVMSISTFVMKLEWLIDVNIMSTQIGLFYAQSLWTYSEHDSLSTYFMQLFSYSLIEYK